MGALMRLIRLTRKGARATLLSILLVIGFCLPAWGAGTCTNFIAAGGFEYDEIILVDDVTRQWVQSSSNSYPPIYICDALGYEECNVLNPNLARSGSGWAWFGGVPSNSVFPEVATLTQNIAITIPQGGIVPLQFYLQTQKDPDSAANLDIDVIKVSMDCTIVTDVLSSEYGMILSEGTEVFSTRASDSGDWTGYIPIILNLSDYADGRSHKLCFKSTTYSSTGFLVDDISRVDKKFVNISKIVNFADDILQPLIDKTLHFQEIRAQTHVDTEDILVNLNASSSVLTLKGGYGCDFAGTPAINSTTSIQSLEVQRGTVTVENISVVSPASMTGLVIKSGGKVIAQNLVLMKGNL